MKKPGEEDRQTGLSPLTIAVALGASAGVWLVIDVLLRVFS
ncbi:MAG: hypothetical protein Q8L48_28935 [Archangium sp.]|nr:hypothetical protein [Archangium sp.]